MRKYTFTFLLLGALACKPPTQLPTTTVSASNSIPVSVGAGDDDTERAHRDFRIRARGESVVIVMYHSITNQQPEVEGEQYSAVTDTLVLGRYERAVKRFMNAVERAQKENDPHN